MNRWLRIEEELGEFILESTLMTQALRRFAAELLYFHLLDPGFEALPKIRTSDIPKEHPNWYRLFVRILNEKALRDLTLNNDDLALSIARETLSWIGTTNQQYVSVNEYIKEEKDYEELKGVLRSQDLDLWLASLDSLRELYPKQGTNWNFYHKALSKENREISNTEQIGTRREQNLFVIRQNILNDWEELLGRKKSKQEEDFLEVSLNRYFKDLKIKVKKLEELGDLLAPFYNFLGQLWNDSIGNWNKIDWDEMEEYAKNMERDVQLRELANLLGRWQREKKVLEEKKVMKEIPRQKWKPSPYGKSEIVGIHHSDHLSAMLPSEIALLSSPETELIWSKKYIEKKLLTFKYRSIEESSTEDIEEEVLEESESEEQGPMILCIDTSGSMFGKPERIAKALSLAILSIAIEQKRHAFLISFSTGFQALEMTGLENDHLRLIEFLRMSFHGGTDIQPALNETLDVLEKENYHTADVLVISDFVIPRIDRKMFDAIQKTRKERGTRFHSLFITRRPDPDLPPLPIFDNHWVYDIENPAVMRQTIDHFHNFDRVNELKV